MLYDQFRQFGTPTEQTWPGVSLLPGYEPCFPVWRQRPLMIDSKFDDFTKKLLTLNPNKRDNSLALLADPIFDLVRDDYPKAAEIESINCNVSILNNSVVTINSTNDFYPVSLTIRASILNNLYQLQKHNKWDDDLISFTMLLFDMFSTSFTDDLTIYSCLYIASIILDIDIYSKLKLLIVNKTRFTDLNKQILTTSKLDLHISSPLNIADIYVTNEIRDATITCLNLLNYSSIYQRYSSETIALLAIKLASIYLDKVFKYDNKLDNLINKNIYSILITDFDNSGNIYFPILDRGIVSSKDIVNLITKLAILP